MGTDIQCLKKDLVSLREQKLDSSLFHSQSRSLTQQVTTVKYAT